MAEQNPENKAAMQVDEVDLLKDEQPERPLTPLERILQNFRKAHPASRPSASAGRNELGKDKSKSLFLLVAAAVVVLLFFLAIFSSPQKPKQGQLATHRAIPISANALHLAKIRSRPVPLPRCSPRIRENSNPRGAAR